ncbi:hypothetical protein [Stieleria mannarensis]|uniref:hypothetical protein n=1 Tax=Stieleria mannarensis TaxID=2755585 RepID=UPI0015FFCEDC|nr:hypothetical protein [Rhodopirellula sp. JC639]
MKDAAILASFSVIGFAVGAGAVASTVVREPLIIVAAGLSAAALGALLGGVIGTISRKTSIRRTNSSIRVRRKKNEMRPVGTSKSFRTRLAGFVHKPESEVMADSDPVKSRMTFWTSARAFSRHPPKPSWLIRHYIIRIRQILSRHKRR